MRGNYIDVGFWPDVWGPPPTSEERRLLPEKSKLMDQDIAEAEVVRQKAIADCTDPTWKQDHPDEYAVVLAYLSNPERTEQYRGSSRCRVCGHWPNGSQDWFKGSFRYPQGYVHYIVEHGVKPPQAVIDAAMGR